MATPITIISRWSKLLDGVQLSSLETYNAIEEAIGRREIPDATTSRVEFPEGGPLSAKRQYLRVTRGEHVFDICAAPFGSGFFFSSWLTQLPAQLTAGDLIAISLVVFGLLVALTQVLDGFTGFAIWSVGVFVGWGVLYTVSQQSRAELDAQILSIPVIGPLYDALFHPLTYYRIDSALMFQQAVHGALLEVIDTLTAAKGIRALSESERQPILREFYMR